MSSYRIPRRRLLKHALLGIAAAPAVGWLSRAESAPVELNVNDAQAKALGYVEDATKVDATANPNYKPGQNCANCLQAQGKPGDALLPCNIFPGKLVRAKGWCKVWVKRP
jgi:High potential iron-sulfur protein